MQYIVWNGTAGRVCSQGVVFDIDTPPVLGFAYDWVFYEPALGRAVLVEAGVQRELTAEEVQACSIFCDTFEAQANYTVWAYDASGVFVGEKLRQDPLVLNGTYGFLHSPPDHPASKVVGTEWKRIIATINDEGYLALDPTSICPRCVLLFTEEEWASFPKPTHDYETWDAVQEKWADKRILSRLKENAVVTIQNAYEAVRWKAWGTYVAPFDMVSWPLQVAEARAYLASSASATPYMDSYLAGTVPDRNKVDLAQDILAKSDAFASTIGSVNAEQWQWLKAVEAAATNAEVDAIMSNVVEATKPNTLRG